MRSNTQLDTPLSDNEFEELDRFLMSSAVGDEGMTMDALHGYLTAIAIGPEAIPLSEWLPNVWGPSEEDTPKFSSGKQEQRVINLIARYMHEIQNTFEVAPKEFEPLFCVYTSNNQEVLDVGMGILGGDAVASPGVGCRLLVPTSPLATPHLSTGCK